MRWWRVVQSLNLLCRKVIKFKIISIFNAEHGFARARCARRAPTSPPPAPPRAPPVPGTRLRYHLRQTRPTASVTPASAARPEARARCARPGATSSAASAFHATTTQTLCLVLSAPRRASAAPATSARRAAPAGRARTGPSTRQQQRLRRLRAQRQHLGDSLDQRHCLPLRAGPDADCRRLYAVRQQHLQACPQQRLLHRLHAALDLAAGLRQPRRLRVLRHDVVVVYY
jgi:hypothetical protein